jgi:hypothetical protein
MRIQFVLPWRGLAVGSVHQFADGMANLLIGQKFAVAVKEHTEYMVQPIPIDVDLSFARPRRGRPPKAVVTA